MARHFHPDDADCIHRLAGGFADEDRSADSVRHRLRLLLAVLHDNSRLGKRDNGEGAPAHDGNASLRVLVRCCWCWLLLLANEQ